MGELRTWTVVVAIAMVAACTPRDALSTATSGADVTGDGGMDADADADAGDAGLDGGEAGMDAPPDSGGFDSGGEAGMDAGVDSSIDIDGSIVADGGFDAGADAMVDGGGEAGVDGGIDAAPDAGTFDAGTDGGTSDAGQDAGLDGGMLDAGPDGGTPDGGTAVVVVDVAPALIDFGEVRVGAADPSASIVVTNQPASTGPASITSFALRGGSVGLTLTPPSLPVTLAPGVSTQGTLTLGTLAETDLAGEYVDIVVAGSTRSVEVRGKVVTPSSRVEPLDLDLGAACVGSQVSGTVVLINDGTATLAVDAPQVDAPFTVAGTSGALAPMQSLSAAVSLASTAAGEYAGLLRWHDDVPFDHEVPVRVEFVASGTAISPKGLDFGALRVGAPRITREVRLENCDPAPSTLEIVSLRATRGPLSAWQIIPGVGTRRQLASRDVEQISVTFEPLGRGPYEAELTVVTSDGTKVIQLIAEATGRDFETGSFYMCMCTGGGPVQYSWPIPAALVVILARRRRRATA